ncbi:hypothetical protein F5Y01DRAFT_302495 [Xylaria sp. FL0043]|nr:hypothetical protein F5Y01DRAFT_302495 [Xylaria sp. FL0043]
MASPEREDSRDHQRQLPFCFGCEIETMVRPKTSTGLTPLSDVPSVSQQRRYNFSILKVIARAMTDAGLACQVFDPAEQEYPDYTVWNVMLDASLSKHHICDAFCERTNPVEIVSPDVMNRYFEFRQDTTCGFHEPATARCAPLSRQDRVNEFCKSNLKGPRILEILRKYGPLKGVRRIFNIIDELSRNDLVDFICPGKHYAWNLQPSKEGRSGSIEFRRPPGVITGKKSKHWIAFTMAFIWMAVKFDPEKFLSAWVNAERNHREVFHPDFQAQLLSSAQDIGEHWNLDSRLLQMDDVAKLHITMMSEEGFSWLYEKELGYTWSENR